MLPDEFRAFGDAELIRNKLGLLMSDIRACKTISACETILASSGVEDFWLILNTQRAEDDADTRKPR